MNSPLLAIAASSFSQSSETFIRDHARTIAPGRTLLISQHEVESGLDCVDALTGVDMGAWRAGPSTIPRPFLNVRRYWRRYAHPRLPDGDRVRLVDFLRRSNPAALMAEYGPTGVMLAKAAKAAGTPLYVHFHGFDAAVMPRIPLWRARYQSLFEMADGVIGPSRYIAEKLVALGSPPEKTHVCACGIDPARFTVHKGEEGRIIAVGRLVRKKAPQLTIRAFAEVASEFPCARLDMVGGGPLRAACEEIIRIRGLEGRVVLHGVQNHEAVAALFRKASIFAQHSVTSSFGDVEGMPVSVLEAMASGLPVVSTRHSGIPEAVIEGETGRLVDEGDVNAMADAMRSLLQNPALAERMGEAGRARALQLFTQEKSAQTLRSIMKL